MTIKSETKRILIHNILKTPSSYQQGDIFQGGIVSDAMGLTLNTGEQAILEEVTTKGPFAFPEDVPPDTIEINAADKFEALLIPIIKMNREMRAKYTGDINIYVNYDRAATQVGLAPLDVIDAVMALENSRVTGLRGRENESGPIQILKAAYLDRAIFGVLAYGLFLRDYVGEQ